MLVERIIEQMSEFDEVVKIIFPPFPYLDVVQTRTAQKSNCFTGAQNCHSHASGAYTGEVSAAMLASVGCQYVLVGHSERRQYFREKEAELVLKCREALKNGLKPVLCVGETIHERKTDNHFKVVSEQLSLVLKEFSLDEFRQFVIAYEPVWAIGTGETATAKQAQEMHAYIRGVIGDIYDSAMAAQVSILYGGSCNPQNARELFACPDVDGGLIGGASLNADDFCKIVFSF